MRFIQTIFFAPVRPCLISRALGITVYARRYVGRRVHRAYTHWCRGGAVAAGIPLMVYAVPARAKPFAHHRRRWRDADVVNAWTVPRRPFARVSIGGDGRILRAAYVPAPRSRLTAPLPSLSRPLASTDGLRPPAPVARRRILHSRFGYCVFPSTALPLSATTLSPTLPHITFPLTHPTISFAPATLSLFPLPIAFPASRSVTLARTDPPFATPSRTIPSASLWIKSGYAISSVAPADEPTVFEGNSGTFPPSLSLTHPLSHTRTLGGSLSISVS